MLSPRPRSIAFLLWLILIGFSCLLISRCTTDTNHLVEKVQYYGTGEVSRRFTEINGKKEGKMLDYYPDGRLKGERFFKNDQQVGRTVLYYPGGKIKETQHYANGLKQGGDTVWYENGQAQFALSYHEGKKHGYLRKWTPEGVLAFEAKYQLDTLVEVKGENVRNAAGSLDPDSIDLQ